MLRDSPITIRRNTFASLGRALGIRAGEEEPFLLMFGMAFFLGVMMITYYTAANSLFLVEFGAEAFPYVYLASAAAIILVGLAFARLERALPFPSLLMTTTGFMIVSTSALWAGLRFVPAPWIVFVSMVWMRLLWVVSNLVLWAMLGRLFNVRQGKRLFSLVLAGSVISFITVGLAASLLIQLVGLVNLLFIAVLGLFPALWLLLVTIRRHGPALANPPVRRDAAESSGRRSMGERQLFRGRYILIFFLFTALSTVATFVLDFGFLTEAGTYFDDGDQLGSFFGRYVGVSMILLLLISLVSGRIFERFGLSAGLLLNPILVGIGALIITITGTLLGGAGIIFWLVIGTKLVDDIMVTMNNAGRNLLYQPLPTGQRVRVQAAVESMIQPAFVGVVGMMLLAFRALGEFNTTFVYVLLLVFTLGWLVAGIWLRREYLVQLKSALARRRFSNDDASLILDPAALELLRTQLNNPRAGVVIYALDVLSANDAAALTPALPALLDHPAPEVRRRALAYIEQHRVSTLQTTVQARLAVEPDASLKSATLRTLASLGAVEPVIEMLPDADAHVQLGALSGLLLHGGLEGMLHALEKLSDLAGSSKPTERELAARVMAEVGADSFYRPIRGLLVDPDPAVQKAALKAAASVRNPALWPLVIEKLSQPALAGPAAAALAAGGENLVPLLAEAVDAEPETAVTAQLAHVLGRIGGEQAKAALLRQVDRSRPHARGELYEALSRCHYQVNGLDDAPIWSYVEDEISRTLWLLRLSVGLDAEGLAPAALDLLQMALRQQTDRARQRILLLLSFVYEPDPLHNIRQLFVLPTATEREKADALEILDIILPDDLKRSILPLLQDTSPAERLKQLADAKLVGEDPLALTDLLCLAAGEETGWLVACGLYAAGASSRSDLLPLMAPHLSHAHGLVRDTAAWAQQRMQLQGQLDGNQKHRKATMLSTIERVLFLKGMDLFDHVPGEDLVAVARVAQEVQFTAGETFIEQDEIGDCLYFILDGHARVTVDQGQEVAMLGPESVLGEMSILTSNRRTASASAVSDLSALKIARQDFQDLMLENPELSRGIIDVLVRRLNDANRKLAQPHPMP